LGTARDRRPSLTADCLTAECRELMRRRSHRPAERDSSDSERWENLGFTTARTVATNGIDVSPDRRWLYYSQADERGSRVMLVETFR
jgi:hypothetical protein